MAIRGEGSDPAHRSTNRAVGLELSAFPAGSVIGDRLGLAEPGRTPAGSLDRQIEGRHVSAFK